MFAPPRKQIRLAPDEYIGRGIYFITLCTQDRIPIFHDARRCRMAIDALRIVANRLKFIIHAYCLMPDHTHLLVEGQTPSSNLLRFVLQWKQLTGYLFRRELPPRFWQRRFYDHILRHAEDSEAVAWYIWKNPVRKGMVEKPELYPFSGSFTLDWPKVFSPPSCAWTPPWKEQSAAAGTAGTR
jgi:putative transposase